MKVFWLDIFYIYVVLNLHKNLIVLSIKCNFIYCYLMSYLMSYRLMQLWGKLIIGEAANGNSSVNAECYNN